MSIVQNHAAAREDYDSLVNRWISCSGGKRVTSAFVGAVVLGHSIETSIAHRTREVRRERNNVEFSTTEFQSAQP